MPLLNELIKSGHPSPTSRDGKFSAFADWSQSHPRMCPGRQQDMHWTARSNKVINEPGTIVRSPRNPPPAIFTNTGDLVISHLTNNLPCRNVLHGFVRNRGRSTPIPSISPPQPRTAHPSLNLMNSYSKQIAGTWRHCSSARIFRLSLSMKRLRAMQSPCCRLVMICFIISAKSFPHVVPFSSRIFLSHIWQNVVQEVPCM